MNGILNKNVTHDGGGSGFQIESSVYLARDCGLDNSLVTMRRREYVGRRGKEVRVSRYKSTADER